ncbi:GNAT family N-acetyltransferase [Enterococcus termitis]|uniref:GNAT family N-acetyltransferase n=1 Tax=Enterococcus termitis TaxID=332950 RepID=UPI00091CB852|nr:GNAT family N-acetyltransferase [Enterococcus termitis]OJG99274.1 hypothetical protein RV18_GL001342 [Enterococcus termitis]
MIVVREMTKQDVPKLRKIYLETRIKTFEWIDPKNFELADFDKDTEEEIILVAESNGSPVGFISLYAPDSFIHCLFVDWAWKGTGVGHLLLEEAKGYLPLPLKLKCVSKNTSALAFYKKEGWKLVDEVTDTENYWNLVYGE